MVATRKKMKFTILKEIFASFVRTRHVARHFRRLALLDTLTQTGVSREVPASLTKTLVAAANSDTEALLKQLDSHSDGLSEAQAVAMAIELLERSAGRDDP
jgi:Mg2+-importing ATPase